MLIKKRWRKSVIDRPQLECLHAQLYGVEVGYLRVKLCGVATANQLHKMVHLSDRRR